MSKFLTRAPANDAGTSSRARRVAVSLTIGVSAVLALFTAIDFIGAATVWINGYWLSCSLGAFALSLIGTFQAHNAVRKARVALSLGLGTYCVGQIVWAVQVGIGLDIVPGPSDVFFLLAPIPIVWATLAGFRGDISVASSNTVWLDGLTLTLAITAIVLAEFGAQAARLNVLEGATILLYPILYLMPVGASLVAVMMIPEKPRLSGIWMLLLGAVLLGVSFVSWTSIALSGVPPVGHLVDYAFGIGLGLVGWGALTWKKRPAITGRLSRSFRIIADVLPITAIVIAVVGTLRMETTGTIAIFSWLTAIVAVSVNGLRQVLLIRSQRQSQDSLHVLATELSNTEEEQRRVIATFLHDRVAQELVGMRMKLSMLRATTDETVAKRLAGEIDEILCECIENTQSTTFELNSPTLVEHGFLPAVQQLAMDLHEKYSFSVEVVDDGQDKPLNDSIASLLYRFIRELLINVLKHAAVTSAEVTIARDNHTIIIEVVDGGVGFEEGDIKQQQGFGLYSIRERSLAIGGGFSIRGKPGEGTRATIWAPLGPN